VGALGSGGSATLQVVATVANADPKTFTAQVATVDQPDPNSTPGNNNATEDDQASVRIAVPIADLSLTKTANTLTPNLGSSVTFQTTVLNAGPDAASGVAVTDVLPPGLVFVNASTTQGSYSTATGFWTVGSIPKGGSATLSITTTVNADGLKTNTAQISAADQFDPDSTPNNNAASEDDQSSVSVSPQAADLSLTATVDNATPNVGNQISFTLTLTNNGPSNATGVAVRDVLPGGLTYVSSTPTAGAYNPTSGIWTIGPLADKAVATLQIVATVGTAAAITNTAEVSGSDQTDPNSTPGNGKAGENDQSTATVTPQQADLSLDKTVDTAAPQVGRNVTFTLTVNNAGPNTATNVAVKDLLPSGLTFVSATTSNGTYNTGSGIWSVPSISMGVPATLQIVATVTDQAAISNTVEITAADQADPDSRPDNHVATEDDQKTVAVTPQIADLSLAQAANPVRPNVGQPVTFTLTVNNAGPNSATGVAVKDLLPDGMTFVSVVPSQGAYNATTGIWTVGSVARGATATLLLTAKVDGVLAKTNTAEISAADQFDPNSTPNNANARENDQASVTLTPQQAELSVTKIVDDPSPNINANVTFTVTVNNAGPDAATGVRVQDRLTNEFAFVSSTVSQGTYDQHTGMWSVGTLSSSSTATLRLVAKVVAKPIPQEPDARANVARVEADQFDSDSTDNQANVNLIAKSADLSLSKRVDNGEPNVGDTVTFTITLNNAGPDTATGVTVRDRVPAGLTYDTSKPPQPSQGTFDLATGQWTVDSIAKNTNLTLKVSAKVMERGTKTETAEVTAADQFDPDSTPGNNKSTEDDQASVDVRIKSADLSLTSQVDNSAPNVGENVKLTLTLANAGPDGATGAVVSAPLPAGLSHVSSTPSQGTYSAATGRWELDAVAPSANATLEIVAKVETSAVKTLAAEVVAVNEADPDSTISNQPGEDDQTSQTLTPQVVDLGVVVVATPDPVYVGQEATYKLTVSNAGSSTAKGVKLTQTLPSSVSLAGQPVLSQGSYDAATGIWTIGSLLQGGAATMTLIVTVGTGTSDTLTHVAAVTSAPQFDSNPANNTATTRTAVRSRIAGYLVLRTDPSITSPERSDRDLEIGGAQVDLLDETGKTVIRTTRTSSSGAYEFTGLAPGKYHVQAKNTLFDLKSLDPGDHPLLEPPVDSYFFQLGTSDNAEDFNFIESVDFKLVSRRNYLASSP
jgi:uncharacterized repeat protein (TIGR01451 family)